MTLCNAGGWCWALKRRKRPAVCWVSASCVGIKALAALYDESDKRERRGGLGASAPKVSTWLGDIREFFPQSVVQVMQQDAVERLNLSSLLTEKEMLVNVVPDMHLVATLMSLRLRDRKSVV